MYHVMKSVITAGGFKLTDIQHKVKKLWLQGDLTEEQADQLTALAASSANADAERPELLQMIQTLAAELSELKSRMDTLEGVKTEGEASGYPAWQPWDGISNLYRFGAVVSHRGKLWISRYSGQNVWEPGTAGVQFWEEFAE